MAIQHRKNEEPARGGIQVIGRAAHILRTVAGQAEGLSLGQIAKRVALPRSTVQRIVNALATEGLVTTPSISSRVRLGPGLLALASQSRRYVVELTHPRLQRLSSEIGETIDLAIFQGDHIEFVDQIAGAQRLRAVSAIGEKFPLHNTASGKACLALLSDSEIQVAVSTVFDDRDDRADALRKLMSEIGEVRRTGIAHDNEEHSAGITAIGVGFRDRLNDIYAISIPAPTARAHIDLERKKQLLGRALEEIKQIVGSDS